MHIVPIFHPQSDFLLKSRADLNTELTRSPVEEVESRAVIKEKKSELPCFNCHEGREGTFQSCNNRSVVPHHSNVGTKYAVKMFSKTLITILVDQALCN